MAKKKILLTGFEPFGGESLNPSQKLLDWMSANQKEVECLLLPVSYEKSVQLVKQKVNESVQNKAPYTDILMLGQAGGRVKIDIEKVALNYAHSDQADSDGIVLHHKIIDPQTEAAFFSSYDFSKIEKGAKNWNLPLGISFSAGSYVCNYLSFSVAQMAKEENLRWMFVHFPYLPEQLNQKPENTPFLKFSDMQSALLFLLEHIRDA